MNQHFCGLSGGKDSLLTAIRAIKRFETKPPTNLPLRFQTADTGNEWEGWRDYIDYLSRALGVDIEIVKADFAAEFAERRANIVREWSKEKRIRTHSPDCRGRGENMTRRERMKLCNCRENVLPPVHPDMIQRALDLLVPTGNPFLDLCMLKGRFPGAKSRFCTDRLKIEPMMAAKLPLLADGVNIVEWLGERAQESTDRAKKPRFTRIRHPNATQILYRPIHHLLVDEVFDEIAHFGIKVNPLYDMGASRVGCWPCIMCGKDEINLIARMTPEEIDRLREWEHIVGLVSRRLKATFFAAKMVPGDKEDEGRARIDNVVSWAKTSRGGRQIDMFQTGIIAEAEQEGWFCGGEGMCE